MNPNPLFHQRCFSTPTPSNETPPPPAVAKRHLLSSPRQSVLHYNVHSCPPPPLRKAGGGRDPKCVRHLRLARRCAAPLARTLVLTIQPERGRASKGRPFCHQAVCCDLRTCVATLWSTALAHGAHQECCKTASHRLQQREDGAHEHARARLAVVPSSLTRSQSIIFSCNLAYRRIQDVFLFCRRFDHKYISDFIPTRCFVKLICKCKGTY